MFVRVHSNKEVRGGNTGSCFALVNYLSKEGGDFFSHTQGDSFDMFQVMDQIDNNKSKLGSEDAKFYMLSINPSQEELCHLLGRQVKNNEELTAEDRQTLSEKLQDYTRSCMDEYARSFGRENIRGGEDLLYYAKIETERRYKFDDQEVQKGKAKIDTLKEGLNWHVHVIVSRKSKDGATKLSPTVKSRGNEWINGEGREMKRGFNHTLWKQSCGSLFATQYDYRLGAKEAAPKVESMREIALKKVYDKEFREVLIKGYSSIGKIDEAMKQRGWKVKIENNKHCYSKGKKSCYLPEFRLKAFVSPLSDDAIDNILRRLRPFEVGSMRDSCGEGLVIEERCYTVKGEERKYSVVCDKVSGAEIPLSKLMKQVKGKRLHSLLETMKNSDLRDAVVNSFSTDQIVESMLSKGYEHLQGEDGENFLFIKNNDQVELRKDAVIPYYIATNKIKSVVESAKESKEDGIKANISNQDLKDSIEKSARMHLVISSMKEQGYEVKFGRRLSFSAKDGRCALMYWNDIKLLYSKSNTEISKEAIDNILQRFRPFEVGCMRDSCGEGLEMKERIFATRSGRSQYNAICDKKSGAEISLGSLMKKGADQNLNSLIENISNPDFRFALMNSRSLDRIVDSMGRSGYGVSIGSDTLSFERTGEKVEVRTQAILSYFSIANKRESIVANIGDTEKIKSSISNMDLKDAIGQSATAEQLMHFMKKRGYEHIPGKRCYFEAKDGRCAVIYWNDLKRFFPDTVNYIPRFTGSRSTKTRVNVGSRSLGGGKKVQSLVAKTAMNANPKESLDEIRVMKHVSFKTKQAMQMIINPKIALKNIVLSSVRNILEGGKEL